MSSLGTIDGVGDGVERVAVAPFSPKGLYRASNGGVSDVSGAEVVHVGCVGPAGRDRRVAVVHALVGAGHVEILRGRRVSEPRLRHIRRGHGHCTEGDGGTNSARVGADAR